MRSLYDEEFLAAGCPPEDYDEVYEVDDTVGTYITNFFFLVVCLVAVLKLWCLQKETKNKYMIAFFWFNGLSFGIAGFFHADDHTRDNPSKDPYTRILFFLYGISTVCFSLAVLGLVTDNVIAWWAVSIITTAITVYTTIVIDHFLVGVLVNLFIIFPLACIVYELQVCRQSEEQKCNYVAKMLGVLFMFLGLVVQLVLRGTCGGGGYEDYFEECPLPNPTKFNHNALFHLLHLIGVILLAVAEDRHPSCSARTKDDCIADDATKDSPGASNQKVGQSSGNAAATSKEGAGFSSEEVSEA
jgi:high-affinity nickel permease